MTHATIGMLLWRPLGATNNRANIKSLAAAALVLTAFGSHAQSDSRYSPSRPTASIPLIEVTVSVDERYILKPQSGNAMMVDVFKEPFTSASAPIGSANMQTGTLQPFGPDYAANGHILEQVKQAYLEHRAAPYSPPSSSSSPSAPPAVTPQVAPQYATLISPPTPPDTSGTWDPAKRQATFTLSTGPLTVAHSVGHPGLEATFLDQKGRTHTVEVSHHGDSAAGKLGQSASHLGQSVLFYGRESSIASTFSLVTVDHGRFKGELVDNGGSVSVGRNEKAAKDNTVKPYLEVVAPYILKMMQMEESAGTPNPDSASLEKTKGMLSHFGEDVPKALLVVSLIPNQ